MLLPAQLMLLSLLAVPPVVPVVLPVVPEQRAPEL